MTNHAPSDWGEERIKEVRCTLLDSAAGCAIHSSLPAGVGYSSIEIKISFLKAPRAAAGVIEVSGRVLRVGDTRRRRMPMPWSLRRNDAFDAA